MWGATITVLVGALVNTAAEGVFGESVAAVAVAPFVEETMKGLGVLWAVRRREVEGAMDGIAVATHALLNGAWEVAGVRLSPVGIALYLALLIPVAIWVISARRKQADQFIAAIPALPQRYALPPPQEEANFATWRGMLAHRRQLPRDQRRQFDARRTSLARLTEQLARPGGPDPDREQELADQLQQSHAGQ